MKVQKKEIVFKKNKSFALSYYYKVIHTSCKLALNLLESLACLCTIFLYTPITSTTSCNTLPKECC